jgi:hypothetical protein
MRRFLATAVTSMALLLVTAPIPAGAGQPGVAAPDRVVAHWTPARLRAAVPRDVVFTGAGFSVGRVAVPAAAAPRAAAGSISGASWTKGGLVLRASGRVYFEVAGGAWICSGAVAQDSRTGNSLVLTAGHCAYDQATRTFATNWMFIPEFDSAPVYDCTQAKWGCWSANALVVSNAFASAASYNSTAAANDVAFAVVGAGGQASTQLDAAVGALPIAFSGVRAGNKVYAFGYPAQGKYTGSDLVYCAGAITQDLYMLFRTWGMACDMTGGASGGPWLSGFNETTGGGTLASVNAYVYVGSSVMYGPKFTATTQGVYKAADKATANTIVP